MAHAEGFEFGVEFFHAFFAELVNARAAVGGHDLKELRVDAEELGNEVAAARFEVAEDADLVVKALLGEVAFEDFMHQAVIADSDEGSRRVFDL